MQEEQDRMMQEEQDRMMQEESAEIDAHITTGDSGLDGAPDKPRAKDYNTGLTFPENYEATGLNFGSIYSELVHQKDYESHGTYQGYQFSAKDFEALNVTIDSSGPYSLNEAGVSVSPEGSITIDTNAKIYQSFDEGDQVDVSVGFKVTDDKNQSDIGSVNFQVAGKDENIIDSWQNGQLQSNDTVGDLLGKYAANDVLSTTLNANGNESSVSFDLYSVGSWDGEDFIVKSGEDIILSQSFQASVPFSGTKEGTTTTDEGEFKWSLESEGRSDYGLGKFTQKVAVSIDIPSGLQDVDLSLTSNVDGGINDESWAINEFKVNAGSYINPDQRHTDISGGDVLQLGYALKGNDNTGNPGGEANTFGVNDDGLTNIAVLGPNTSSANSYTLEISGESLKAGWNLESTDIVVKYNADIFREITTNDITIAGELPVNKSISVDDENGLIRFAAASLGNLEQGSSIFGENILASINLSFNDLYFKDSDRNPDANGKFTFAGNPLGFELSANSDETIFSRTFDSDTEGKELAGGAFKNREIKSLGDLNGNTTFDESKVNLYQAEIKFNEQDDGLTFGTKRVIGANQGFTNLIRQGDTVTAQTSIENVGNSLARNLTITDAGNVANAQFTSSRFLNSNGNELNNDTTSPINLSGGVFDDNFNYNSSTQESVNLEIGMHITGVAGSVIDVTKGLFQVSAAGMNQNPDTGDTPEIFVSESGSKNLITFQGDLNYDGRVSMKDLAFLNAGAARQIENNGSVDAASVARDVDADFSGKIDLADLSILDNDWGKSLHTGTEDFTGSSDTLNWTSLAKQDGATWDNSSFTAQNAIEAQDSYIGSLEAPASTGVIGTDGNTASNNGDIQGTEVQDPLAT